MIHGSPTTQEDRFPLAMIPHRTVNKTNGVSELLIEVFIFFMVLIVRDARQIQVVILLVFRS